MVCAVHQAVLGSFDGVPVEGTVTVVGPVPLHAEGVVVAGDHALGVGGGRFAQWREEVPWGRARVLAAGLPLPGAERGDGAIVLHD